MAQAGIHSIAGLAVRKWTSHREWLTLGIVLGNVSPDLDNIAVAIATLTGEPSEGLHRTFTHSLFTVALIIAVFYLVARLTGRARWGNLGLGLGIGVLMHILLDLVIWFNGVEILWPIPSWINLWGRVAPPEWWSQLMMPVEFLAFTLFFLLLASVARKQGTNTSYLNRLRVWTAVQAILFIIFLVLVYTMDKGFTTIYGAVYLLSLGLAIGITIHMKETIEASAEVSVSELRSA